MTIIAAPVEIVAHAMVGRSEAPVVLVLGGISGTMDVVRTAGGRAGWWSEVAGRGQGIDTRRHRVLGIEYLDGGCAPDGRPSSIVRTHDQADAIVALLDALEIGTLHGVVGASYGGMVALALAERYPDRVERAVVISAAHASHPMATGVRAIQRRIVELGLATGRAREGMALARALATTTYRSAEEFAARFDGAATVDGASASFDVERYLLHAGAKFADRMAPSRLLALSLSADLHRVQPERVVVPTTVVAAQGDVLIPATQTDELARRLPRLASHVTLDTLTGHDAFLVETRQVSLILTTALAH